MSSPSDVIQPARVYGAIIENATGAILTMSEIGAVLAFLHECTPNSTHLRALYTASPSSAGLVGLAAENYPTWRWNNKANAFEETSAAVLTDAIRSLSALVHEKGKAVTLVIRALRTVRESVSTNIFMQDTVYAMKRAQAQRFKDAGYDERMLTDVQFVVQYADYAGVSLQQAADDILFKSKLSEDVLAKSELLRLKYFDLIRAATTAAELAKILEQFQIECFSHQLT